MEQGDIMGHAFMGEVVEIGKEVKNLKPGGRVVVPFAISYGQCFFCKKSTTSLCENSNPNSWLAEKLWGHSPAGLFGYSHLSGGFAGAGGVRASALCGCGTGQDRERLYG